MALLEKHLLVKKSTIPNSGKGLFTKKFIPKGKKIVEYKGVKTVWKEVKDDDGKNGYIFYINRNCVIDAMPSTHELGRYANDARGIVRVEGIKNNSEYVVEGKRCFIVAKKDIPPNSEILVGYGGDYWNVIKHNWKVEKQKTKKTTKGKKTKKTTKSEKTRKANSAKPSGSKTRSSKKAASKKAKGTKSGRKKTQR